VGSDTYNSKGYPSAGDFTRVPLKIKDAPIIAFETSSNPSISLSITTYKFLKQLPSFRTTKQNDDPLDLVPFAQPVTLITCPTYYS